jgi:hypothetical protein
MKAFELKSMGLESAAIIGRRYVAFDTSWGRVFWACYRSRCKNGSHHEMIALQFSPDL